MQKHTPGVSEKRERKEVAFNLIAVSTITMGTFTTVVLSHQMARYTAMIIAAEYVLYCIAG